MTGQILLINGTGTDAGVRNGAAHITDSQT